MINWRRGISSADRYRSSENLRMSRQPYAVLLMATRCLYVKPMQCSGIPQIHGQIGGYISPGYMCILLQLNLCGVVVFHRSMVNWRRGALVYEHSAICETYLMQRYSVHQRPIRGGALVYVHSAICEMYMMQWYSIDLWSIGGEGRSELIWCSGIPHIYDQLEEGDQLS